MVTRRSLNTYVGIGNDLSGFWLPAIGQYTGSSTITFFDDNSAIDGTLTQFSDDVVISRNGDKVFTSSKTLIVPSSATEGTYTGTFEITGGTGKFKKEKGSFMVPNGRYDEEEATHNALGTISYSVKKRYRGHGPDHHDDDDCDHD